MEMAGKQTEGRSLNEEAWEKNNYDEEEDINEYEEEGGRVRRLNDQGYEETAVDIPCKSIHFDSPKSLDVSCKVQYTPPRCAPVQIVPTQIMSQMEDDNDFGLLHENA